MNDNHFKFSLSVLVLPMLFVLSMWSVFWFEVKFHHDWSSFGIYPRTLEGLRGVAFSPFLHGNAEHLYNNSIPLFILLAALRYFYRAISLPILGYGILFSGLITWIIGRDAYHIGASSLIYVLVSFVFFKGILTKYYRLVALSFLVILIYGSLIWYVFPHVDEQISWEGHFAGLITGFGFAIYFKTPDYKKLIRYEWEQPDYNPIDDKFLQRFDENGNFVNLPKTELVEELPSVEEKYFTSNTNVVYDFKSKNDDL